MQKLKSMKRFEDEMLDSVKMLNILGGSGGPASNGGFSSRYMTDNTQNPLDGCTDKTSRIDTDMNGGAWVRGVSNTICQETPESTTCW